MKEKYYISKSESMKCAKVARAFTELYEREDANMAICDAGRYGYIKADYYKEGEGFEDIFTFTSSKALFVELWHDWLYLTLLEKAKGTPLMELDYKEIYQCMPPATKRMISRKKKSFLRKAGMVPTKKR